MATETTETTVIDRRARGVVRLLGGPGTGKSSLLIESAAAHIRAGVDPESVLLLTGSGRLGLRARSALTATLLEAGGGTVVRRPLVRSVHAYAFAVLKLVATRAGDPPPRLITGAEQDAIIRELLAGDLEDGAGRWPVSLQPALGTAGFATALRDLLARCAERGIDPLQLRRLGTLTGRPEWTAAGRFAQQYEQVMLLRAAVGAAAPQATVPALSAAELVGAALEALAVDPDLLAAEHNRIRLLLVDDAQHLDPQAARLVRVLARGAARTVIAGDAGEAVFGFRGADSGLLRDEATPQVVLTASHRCSQAVARAVNGIAAALRGTGDIHEIHSASKDPGVVQVQLAASEHAESALIADALRHAHLIDGVPWSQMAVIVRSVSRVAPGLSRVLSSAGVPVVPPADPAPLSANPTVATLLTVLQASDHGLDGARAEALLTGPAGRVDPVSLRQLRRALRRADGVQPPRPFGDLLVDALTGRKAVGIPPAHTGALRRIRAMLTAAQGCNSSEADPRAVLWQVWHHSGLQRRLLTAAERGGSAGARASADLDTVTALFDVAEQYVARTAGASVRGLVEHVATLQLRGPVEERSVVPDAVSILSPHQTLGREWDVVVIAGLQEGLWPNTVPRGGILATQRLLDTLDGVAGEVSTRAPLLAEERRLLICALGRARHRLVITAVDSDARDEVALPSPFFAELSRFATEPSLSAEPVIAPRVLSPAAVIGRLRSIVCAPDDAVCDQERVSAAAQLARLAEAGFAGTDPASWYGSTPVSTDEPVTDLQAAEVITLSPSTLQTLDDCPLRWLLERHGGSDARDLRSTVGTLVHALISDPAKSPAQMVAELEAVWNMLPFDSQWFARNELDRHRAMLATFTAWREQTRHRLTEVGTEVDVDGVVLPAEGAEPGVRVRGRIDRLERDAEGRLVVVDVKTGKSPVSKDDAQRHAQLALYQLAVAEGLLEPDAEPGGARLVYVGKVTAGGAAEREQDAMTPEAREQWRAVVRRAATATAGPQFVARVNDGCAHCPMRLGCPAHSDSEGSDQV